MEFISAISKEYHLKDTQAIADADYSEKLKSILSDIDTRFYDLDEKRDVTNLTKKLLKNIPEEKTCY